MRLGQQVPGGDVGQRASRRRQQGPQLCPWKDGRASVINAPTGIAADSVSTQPSPRRRGAPTAARTAANEMPTGS